MFKNLVKCQLHLQSNLKLPFYISSYIFYYINNVAQKNENFH